MSNPLLETHELPPFGKINADHMVPAIKQLIADIEAGVESAVASGDANLVGIREALEDRLQQAFAPVSHLNAVANTPEIREAHAECLQLLSAHSTKMGQDAALFAAYNTIADGPAMADMDEAGQKVISNALRDFRLSGIDLEPEDQARYAELSARLAELSSQFSNNVLDATEAYARHITTREDLSGIPDNLLGLLEQLAVQRELDGYVVTLDAPSYLAVMNHADNRALREETYRAFGTRASNFGPNAGEFDNSAIMEEILSCRAEQAALLGFDSYADVSIERKMAGSTDEVVDFLRNLASKSRPVAEAELAEIVAFASSTDGLDKVEPWDVPYYAEKLKKAKYDVSQEELRAYFPAPTVLTGMFEVVRRLYDIEVSEVTDMPTWHDDVTTYEIRRRGERIARFYVDLYARTGKRGGAWMADCRVRRRRDDGTLQLPVAFLTCNFTPPVGDAPALLTHTEVITLFHEFGHGLHHMLTGVERADVSGINGVAWDAVELPSQFMENWCWEEEALGFISGHFETGEPLPQDLLGKMLDARRFQAAMMMVRQLEFGLFDFYLHLGAEDGGDDPIQSTLDAVRDEVAVLKPPADYRFQHGFSHIFSGGYATGYYSYKWAEVLSADAFAKFLEDGIFNRQTGEKFLSTVLEKGGSVDAMELFKAFRGREPDVGALLRQDGIAA